MKKTDYLVSAISLVSLIILFLLGSCNWDIWVLILGIVVAGIGILVFNRQGNNNNDLIDELAELEDQYLD